MSSTNVTYTSLRTLGLLAYDYHQDGMKSNSPIVKYHWSAMHVLRIR